MNTALYEFIFCSTDNGILIADADGVIRHANAAAAALLTSPVENLVGQMPRDCFPDNPALVTLFTAVGEQSSPIDLPRQRCANGIATTLSDNQRVILLQDVTEQSELDTRRQAFITTMAHDLRNPIAALIGYTELVSTSGELNDEQQYFIKRLSQTATKLHDVAAELVDLTWIEAGMPLRYLPLALEESIESVSEELMPVAQGRHITITVSIQAPLPSVMGDADRLRLVVFKLLQNAILYSGSEQIVIVHAWSDEQNVYCSVADRGMGISPDELELIFDRMYRSRSEAVQSIPGGGLGLTLSHRIITRHGGDLWADSDLETGSTFTFKLPATHA